MRKTFKIHCVRMGRGFMNCSCGHELFRIDLTRWTVPEEYRDDNFVRRFGFKMRLDFLRAARGLTNDQVRQLPIGGACDSCGYEHVITLEDLLTVTGSHDLQRKYGAFTIIAAGTELNRQAYKHRPALKRMTVVRYRVGADYLACSNCDERFATLEPWSAAAYFRHWGGTAIGARSYLDVPRDGSRRRKPLLFAETRRGAQGRGMIVRLGFAHCCSPDRPLTGRCLKCGQQITIDAATRATVLRRWLDETL